LGCIQDDVVIPTTNLRGKIIPVGLSPTTVTTTTTSTSSGTQTTTITLRGLSSLIHSGRPARTAVSR